MAVCSSIGPGTVPRDRVDYVNVIGTSWERETLLNIVKLRYGHAPIFFSVTQVLTGYQFQGTVTGGLVASNFTPVSNILGLAGTATAEGQYTDRPTVILYAADRRGFPSEADDADSAKRGAICPSGGLRRGDLDADHARVNQRYQQSSQARPREPHETRSRPEVQSGGPTDTRPAIGRGIGG